MLTVFGDESYDEKKQRVFAVSGLSGTQQEWEGLEPKWIERTGGIPFHAADCESDRGVYKDNTHQQNLKLYADMIKIIAKSSLMGFSATMSLTAYDEFFPDRIENMPYFFCFSHVVQYFSELRQLYIPQERKVEFVFDRNMETQGAAPFLYEYMSRLQEYESISSSLDTLSFAQKDSKIGIQAADIVAREAMKHCDNYLIGSKQLVRRSMEALGFAERFQFDYYGKDFFKGFRNYFDSLEEKEGVNGKDYHKWMKQNKIQGDNAANRLRYLLQLPKPIGNIMP